MCGFGPYESAVVRVEPAGTVTAYTGTSAHGQGHETTFSQIIADHLGVDFDKIVVRHGDTASTPMGNGTGGSRSLAVGGIGHPERGAARCRRRRAASRPACWRPPSRTSCSTDGRYQVKGAPAKALALAQIAATALRRGPARRASSPGSRRPSSSARRSSSIPSAPTSRWSRSIATPARSRLRDYVSVDDCGVRISPTLVTGQVHGGLAQGIAQALLEELVYARDGQLITGSLMDYAVPRADDFPSFATDQTVTPTPLNPLGAKGIGEAATIGSTPAIVNAVVDALRPLGVRAPRHAAPTGDARALANDAVATDYRRPAPLRSQSTAAEPSVSDSVGAGRAAPGEPTDADSAEGVDGVVATGTLGTAGSATLGCATGAGGCATGTGGCATGPGPGPARPGPGAPRQPLAGP